MRRRPFQTWILFVLALVPAVGGIGCGHRDRAPPWAPDRAGSRPPGIVLLCVDTLRADVLAAPGTEGGSMPALAQFARDATTFADASAPAPWTAPSVTSLLTGLRPSRHGLRTPSDIVPPAVTTLAEALSAAGWYATAHTAGGWVSPEQGALQGFSRTSMEFDTRPPEETIAEWDAARPRGKPFLLFLHTFAAHDPYGDKGAFRGGQRTRPAEAVAVAERLVEHLAKGDEPPPTDLRDAFLLGHLADPQSRYAMWETLGKARYDALWRRAPEWLESGWRDGPEGGRVLAGRLRAAYVAGLRYADEIVGRTIAALRGAGLPRETIVAVMGDHGESFGEAGVLYHGLALDESTLRVPLLVRAPGHLPEGAVLRGSCSLLDLAPTLLAWAGVEPPPGLDGVALDPLASGGSGRPVVGEVDRTQRRVARPTSLVSVRTEAAKWILEYSPAEGALVREQVFDLRADPLEQRPLGAERVRDFGPAFCRTVAAERARWLAPGTRPVVSDCP